MFTLNCLSDSLRFLFSLLFQFGFSLVILFLSEFYFHVLNFSLFVSFICLCFYGLHKGIYSSLNTFIIVIFKSLSCTSAKLLSQGYCNRVAGLWRKCIVLWFFTGVDVSGVKPFQVVLAVDIWYCVCGWGVPFFGCCCPLWVLAKCYNREIPDRVRVTNEW